MKHLLIFLTLLISGRAHAVLLDPMLREKIKDACLARHPRAAQFCACVGTRHFRSAKQMPNVARANQDLKWVLKYYTVRNAGALAQLRSDPDNLVEFDGLIGVQCRRQGHS